MLGGGHGAIRVVMLELLSHTRTESAIAAARALGYPPELVGKTVVVAVHGERIRVVVPASTRLSMQKLAGVVGTGVRLLSEEELARAYPQFEVGAVPPFGGPDERTIVDVRVARRAFVVVEAGAHDLSLKLPAQELVATARAAVEDVADA